MGLIALLYSIELYKSNKRNFTTNNIDNNISHNPFNIGSCYGCMIGFVFMAGILVQAHHLIVIFIMTKSPLQLTLGKLNILTNLNITKARLLIIQMHIRSILIVMTTLCP